MLKSPFQFLHLIRLPVRGRRQKGIRQALLTGVSAETGGTGGEGGGTQSSQMAFQVDKTVGAVRDISDQLLTTFVHAQSARGR